MLNPVYGLHILILCHRLLQRSAGWGDEAGKTDFGCGITLLSRQVEGRWEQVNPLMRDEGLMITSFLTRDWVTSMPP